MADLVDQLLARPGLYVGPQADPNDKSGNAPSAARIAVAALPGDSGVSMDYEVLSSTGGRVHAEHAVLARTAHGLVLVTAHTHSSVTTIMRETEPGYFPAAEGDSPFPMAIRLEVPDPGHLVYYWSYGMPGEEIIVRDVGDVRVIE
jgi:hypothetical protein